MKQLKVGILGLGTVGGGAYNVITRNGDEMQRRTGCQITVAQVASRDLEKVKQVTGGNVAFTDDAFAVVNNPEIDVVLELIGGDTIAKELVLKAIENGKHVVTANKALIAVHGNEIFKAAQAKGVVVAYEAAVAGGIPIIKALREGLSANKIEWLAGIINGTTNFILSEMQEKGLAFADVLKEAQALGYAEADPTFDVEGVDAAHKLTIMASIAFGIPLAFDQAYTEGITQLTTTDIEYAKELGYAVKLLGITKKTDAGIELRVHPTLVPEKRLLANVDGAMNAVVVSGDAVGPTLYYGAGAGAEPTASAVLADVVDIARALGTTSTQRVAALGYQPEQQEQLTILPISDIQSAYYLRIQAKDEAGVLADITKVLSEKGISIDAVLQKDTQHKTPLAELAILTSVTKEQYMDEAIATIQALPVVASSIVKIRMESLGK